MLIPLSSLCVRDEHLLNVTSDGYATVNESEFKRLSERDDTPTSPGPRIDHPESLFDLISMREKEAVACHLPPPPSSPRERFVTAKPAKRISTCFSATSPYLHLPWLPCCFLPSDVNTRARFSPSSFRPAPSASLSRVSIFRLSSPCRNF